MSSSEIVSFRHDVRGGIASELRHWYDDLPSADRRVVDRSLGHSMSFLYFQVPVGFVPGILSHWIPDRQVFRFRTHELTPTLEEYARFTGLSLDGDCVRVSAGSMRRQFMGFSGLRRASLLSSITDVHSLSFRFLIDRYGSRDSFSTFHGDFTVTEAVWQSLRVDIFLMCIFAYLYTPFSSDSLDIGVSAVIRGLREGYTVIPLILAETYRSASYCCRTAGRDFRGSSILLYVWFMTHLSPIGQLRRHGFCFRHSIAMQLSFRPSTCVDADTWGYFLSHIEEPFSILIYSGYSSFTGFLTHAGALDFIPLPGLRGVSTYHPLSVLGQFDQWQDIYHSSDAAAYRFLIQPSTEADLIRVYGLWSQRACADFSDHHPGQSPEYISWFHRTADLIFSQGGTGVYDLGLLTASDSQGSIIPSSVISQPATVSSDPDIMTDYEARIQRLILERDQATEQISALSLARDTALRDRDAALSDRDAAVRDREQYAAQVVDVLAHCSDTLASHSATLQTATTLLTRVETEVQQLMTDSDSPDVQILQSALSRMLFDL